MVTNNIKIYNRIYIRSNNLPHASQKELAIYYTLVVNFSLQRFQTLLFLSMRDVTNTSLYGVDVHFEPINIITKP